MGKPHSRNLQKAFDFVGQDFWSSVESQNWPLADRNRSDFADKRPHSLVFPIILMWLWQFLDITDLHNKV